MAVSRKRLSKKIVILSEVEGSLIIPWSLLSNRSKILRQAQDDGGLVPCASRLASVRKSGYTFGDVHRLHARLPSVEKGREPDLTAEGTAQHEMAYPGRDFFWGVATSGYQSEGGYNGPGEPLNNWAWAETARRRRPLRPHVGFLEPRARGFRPLPRHGPQRLSHEHRMVAHPAGHGARRESGPRARRHAAALRRARALQLRAAHRRLPRPRPGADRHAAPFRLPRVARTRRVAEAGDDRPLLRVRGAHRALSAAHAAAGFRLRAAALVHHASTSRISRPSTTISTASSRPATSASSRRCSAWPTCSRPTCAPTG